MISSKKHSEQFKSEFIDLEVLARLPTLELKAKFLVSGFLAGLHKTPFRGASVEFKEYRDYQQGDEIKWIDWKVYARTDRLHVRLRDDESNLTAYLLLDKSASMNFKSEKALMTKWDYARALAAAFLLFLHRQHDRMSMGFIASELEDFSKGGSGSAHFHRLMSSLHREADGPLSNLAFASETAANLVRNRAIVIIISDFYARPDTLEPAVRHLRYKNCETIFLHILDPGEEDFDFGEPILLKELETDFRLEISPDILRREYLEKISSHKFELSETVRRFGGDYLRLRTDEPPLQALGAYMAKRSALL